MKGVSMGDFTGGADIAHLDGECWVCGKLVSRGRHYCNAHKYLGEQARADVQRLLAYRQRKRIRAMIHDWWEHA